ncbi:epoxide hydrolase family protein [Nocardia otitidiscaviarum]|uniref:epoxide hydrolase family protein n=1 Tax=Nocardia otitidiscaviarum TaxID=1823 RepID=UPI001895653A|nr:epoxide hydrolase family protein [Nocardia otitidiscaviarum]MBF6183391.1 epoxide hydrolase [Nocardia otitidiscaviarum]
MSEITPFRIAVPQDDLDDLNQRLARTRLLSELPADQFSGTVDVGIPVPPGWEYGVPLSYVRPLLEHWRNAFDWRSKERWLNTFPQFTTEIDGQRVHFVHVRSPEPDATALMLTHGWPSSFVEFLGLVAELTDPRTHGGDPADAFHVVIPSHPGFAFSGPTTRVGWTSERIAATYVELMARLGYDRYGVHGNDAGALVAPELGRIAPDQVIGVHVDQIFSFPTGAPGELDGLSEAELARMRFGQKFLEHSIHDFSQSAQPSTLAHALSDSPVGQLAWSGQLFGTSLTPEDILTNVAIYWFTNTSASSARLYFENKHGAQASAPTTVPLGLAAFGYDFTPPRAFAERDHSNIVQWNEYDRGGHWAAYEVPDLLLADIRGFIRKVI